MVCYALDDAFSAKLMNDSDYPTFQEAITGKYEDELKLKYWESMGKKIAALGKCNTWTCIPKSLIRKNIPKDQLCLLLEPLRSNIR